MSEFYNNNTTTSTSNMDNPTGGQKRNNDLEDAYNRQQFPASQSNPERTSFESTTQRSNMEDAYNRRQEPLGMDLTGMTHGALSQTATKGAAAGLDYSGADIPDTSMVDQTTSTNDDTYGQDLSSVRDTGARNQAMEGRGPTNEQCHVSDISDTNRMGQISSIYDDTYGAACGQGFDSPTKYYAGTRNQAMEGRGPTEQESHVSDLSSRSFGSSIKPVDTGVTAATSGLRDTDLDDFTGGQRNNMEDANNRSQESLEQLASGDRGTDLDHAARSTIPATIGVDGLDYSGIAIPETYKGDQTTYGDTSSQDLNSSTNRHAGICIPPVNTAEQVRRNQAEEAIMGGHSTEQDSHVSDLSTGRFDSSNKPSTATALAGDHGASRHPMYHGGDVGLDNKARLNAEMQSDVHSAETTYGQPLPASVPQHGVPTNEKPSAGDILKGKAEKMIGKMTGNEEKITKGEERTQGRI